MKCQEGNMNILEAAEALLLLCNRSSPDGPPAAENHFRPPDPHPRAMNSKKTPSFIPPWGIRLRRSICACNLKRGREEEESSSAAAGAACSPSPATPLDFGSVFSDPSTSGSEGFHASYSIAPIKRHRASDITLSASVVQTKGDAVERSTLVDGVTTSKPIKRKGRKKTITELQGQERSLIEEKLMLLKLVESTRKDRDTLIAENQKLKSGMIKLPKAPSASEGAKRAIFLPDLNEPVLMESQLDA